MRYVIVKDNIVVNSIEYDNSSSFQTDGQLIQSDVADIGWQYNGSEFIDPKAAEKEAELVRYKAEEYKVLRSLEYPDFRDYLDGIVKGNQAQIDAYVSACLAVKEKYPKP